MAKCLRLCILESGGGFVSKELLEKCCSIAQHFIFFIPPPPTWLFFLSLTATTTAQNFQMHWPKGKFFGDLRNQFVPNYESK